MPKVIDNDDLYLRDEISASLTKGGKRLDASIGYFNLRGWDQLDDAVELLKPDDDGPAVRILLGMLPDPEEALKKGRSNETPKSADLKTQNTYLEERKKGFRLQLGWGAPDDKDETTLKKLNELLKSGGVRVRFYGKHPLHAKLYLCHRDDKQYPLIGYVGSSNLTFAGMAGQGELNVDIPDQDAADKLHKWFEKRWMDSENNDITEFISGEIEESWAGKERSPYLIHLKTAYHLSADAREGIAGYEIPPAMRGRLLNFQSEAVKIVARNLMRGREGTMIGDVVGLGKTLMATAVALLLFEEEGFKSLVVCPKNLKAMWQSHLDEFDINGTVMSLGETQNHLKELARHRLLIIDESHNLRNPGKKRWTAIRDYVVENEPKVLLLTATPLNKGFQDIAGQLQLFLSLDRDLGMQPDAAIEKKRENPEEFARFTRRLGDRLSTLEAFKESSEPADWQKLLGNYMIRRTRGFIEENYAETEKTENGERKYLKFAGRGDKKYYLPKRSAVPDSVGILPDDPAEKMESEATIDAINQLRFPRFGLGFYVSEEMAQLSTNEEVSIIEGSRATGKNLRGLIRTHFYKRLSSSSIAFHTSLERYLLKNLVVEKALVQGGEVPTSDYEIYNDPELQGEGEKIESDDEDVEAIGLEEVNGDAWDTSAEKNLQMLLDKRPPHINWLRAELFENPELEEKGKDYLTELRHDIETVRALLNNFGGIKPERDSKLQHLLNLLTGKYGQEKVAVFTEYVDTANYLTRHLKAAGIGESVGCVTGQTESPLQIIRRFSPKANNIKEKVENPLRVVVATDVLSEGLNLQDARVVINFDLPWGIIKLIQRAGRVDRIGQNAEEVVVHSLLPSDGVEGEISLRKRIEERLYQNATVVGSDEEILGNPEEISSARREFLRKGTVPKLQPGIEMDVVSTAYRIWNDASKENQDQVKNLPNSVYATLPAGNIEEGEQRKEGVLVYARLNYEGGPVDHFAFSELGAEESKGIDPLTALRMTECSPSDKPRKRREDHHKLAKLAAEKLETQYDAYKMFASKESFKERVIERLKGILDDQQLSLDIQSLTEIFNAIAEAPLTDTAKESLRKSMKSGNEVLKEDLLRLNESGQLIIDTQQGPQNIELLCSMGYTGKAKGGKQRKAVE